LEVIPHCSDFGELAEPTVNHPRKKLKDIAREQQHLHEAREEVTVGPLEMQQCGFWDVEIFKSLVSIMY